MRTSRRHWFFRPLGDSFRDDVIGALGLLAGCALGGLVFGNYGVVLGGAVGVTPLVIGKAVHRGVKRRRGVDRPPTLGPGS